VEDQTCVLRAEMAPSLKLCVDPTPSLHGASVVILGLGTAMPCGDLHGGDGFGRLPLEIAGRSILIWWPELELRSCNSSPRVAVGSAPMAEEARRARRGSCKCNCLLFLLLETVGREENEKYCAQEANVDSPSQNVFHCWTQPKGRQRDQRK
jgi:hypothetical protein